MATYADGPKVQNLYWDIDESLRHLGVSFTGGTLFALRLNALRMSHATKSSKIASNACHLGVRTTVSWGVHTGY